MKNIIVMLLAAACAVSSLMTTAAAAAPLPKDEHRLAVHKGSWTRGHRLSPSDRRRAVPLDTRRYHLAAAPRGFQWVRIGSSILLVGQTSGLILKVVPAPDRSVSAARRFNE